MLHRYFSLTNALGLVKNPRNEEKSSYNYGEFFLSFTRIFHVVGLNSINFFGWIFVSRMATGCVEYVSE